MSEPTLSERFEALAKAATPGPWEAVLLEPSYRVFSRLRAGNAQFIARFYTQHDAAPEDAAFIAFCGTEREAIAAELRAIRAVRAALNRRVTADEIRMSDVAILQSLIADVNRALDAPSEAK